MRSIKYNRPGCFFTHGFVRFSCITVPHARSCHVLCDIITLSPFQVSPSSVPPCGSLATITAGEQRVEVPQGTTLSQLWSSHPALCGGHAFFLFIRALGQRGLPDGHVEVLFRPEDSVAGGRVYCAARIHGSQAKRLLADDNPNRDRPAVIELPDKTTREVPAALQLADVADKLSDCCGPHAKLVLLPKSKCSQRVLVMPEDAVEGGMEYLAQISYGA